MEFTESVAITTQRIVDLRNLVEVFKLIDPKMAAELDQIFPIEDPNDEPFSVEIKTEIAFSINEAISDISALREPGEEAEEKPSKPALVRPLFPP